MTSDSAGWPKQRVCVFFLLEPAPLVRGRDVRSRNTGTFTAAWAGADVLGLPLESLGETIAYLKALRQPTSGGLDGKGLVTLDRTTGFPRGLAAF